MRNLIWLLGLICQTGLAQTWHLQLAWQRTHTNLVRSDLPSQLNAAGTTGRHGGMVGLERDLGKRWWVGGYFSMGEMNYQVQGSLSNEFELSGTYLPQYFGRALEARVGFMPWQSSIGRLRLLLNTGLSVHWVRQNGQTYSTFTFGNSDFEWSQVGFTLMRNLDLHEGQFTSLNVGAELRWNLSRRMGVRLGGQYGYALSAMPTAYYAVDVRYKRKSSDQVSFNQVRYQMAPRLNRLVVEMGCFYSFGKIKSHESEPR